MEDLRAWLNGNRDFETGVPLYFKYGDDKQFASLLYQGKTPFTGEQLFEKLKQAYYRIKNGTPVPEIKTPLPTPVVTASNRIILPDPEPDQKNPALYSSAKAAADKLYKELMNLRAMLFSKCSTHPDANENDPAIVKEREGLVLEMMDLQYKVDSAFADLRHVQDHGELPDQAEPTEALPTNPIFLVNLRDNLRKAINKLKAREQTPKRVASIQEKMKKLDEVNEQISKHISAE